jgi:hypothetical protein
MTLRRALPFVLALAVLPLAPAGAQFAAAPGMAPGMSPGMSGSPFGAPQQGPPPACQQLLSFRDDVAKHGQALQAAGKKKAGAEELCKLFKTFLAAESKMIKGLEERSTTCGVPADVIKQVKGSHGKASEMGKRVCDAAAQGPRPTGPSLSDALGTTPMVPDSTGPKRGAGTFDTLENSPLAR